MLEALSTDFFRVVTHAAVYASVFAAGVVLSQRVKDWFNGVPREVRLAVNDIERVVKTKVAQSQLGVVAHVKESVGVPPPPPAPATVTAPLVEAAKQA